MTKYLEMVASRSALAGIHIETLPNPWYLPRYREFGNLDDRVSLNVRSLSGRHRHRHRHRRQVRLSRRLLPRSLDLKRLAGWLRWPMAAAMVEAVRLHHRIDSKLQAAKQVELRGTQDPFAIWRRSRVPCCTLSC